MKFRKKAIVLFITSTVFSLMMAEIIVRIALPHYNPKRQIIFSRMPEYYNSSIGPINKTVRQRTPKGDFDILIPFNQYGFRDSQDMAHATPTDFFAVGDSFTFGWGVEEDKRFSNRLSGMMGRNVFNIATPGDLKQYIGLINYACDNGATVSNLIVGVCMNNDLYNYHEEPVQHIDESKWKRFLRSQLKSRSALYLACSYEFQKIPLMRKFMESTGISRNIEQLTLKNTYDTKILESSADICAQLTNKAGKEQTWFVIIPSLALWIGDNQEEEARVHEAFVLMLEQKGLNVIDLKPAIERNGQQREYYFKTDPHWNEKGHKIAAEVIIKRLSTKL